MSNKLFQSIVNQMHDTIGKTLGVVDDKGNTIACSDPSRVGEVQTNLGAEHFATGTGFVMNGCTYRPFEGKGRGTFLTFVKGDSELEQNYANLLSVTFSNIKQFFDEKYDRSNFIKNVLMENILPGDIFMKARELHFTTDAARVCLLIKINQPTDVAVFDIVQNLFPEKSKDFVISISETTLALVKEVKNDTTTADLNALAKSIVETLTSEFYVNCSIGIGSVIMNLRELSNSFKEAQIALEVGKVFDTERSIVSYDNLGIARLVYQLPTTLCDMFMREVFKKGSIEALDQEMLFTIQRFFENNLNVSETSRKLFVHRNTLVYRLEKIKKITGLDLREFEDAIVFKVALMVKRYLNSMDKPRLY